MRLCDTETLCKGFLLPAFSTQGEQLFDLRITDLALGVQITPGLWVAILPPIPHLIALACPAAILWTVVPVVVDAVEFVPVWPGSHVFNEVPEVAPAVAHRNTPRPVILERRVVGVVAPGPHVGKHHVEGVVFLPHGFTRLAYTLLYQGHVNC